MAKFKKLGHYTKVAFLVHGRSEYVIVNYIASNLRLKNEIFSKEKGYKSIQITSVKLHLKKIKRGSNGSLKKFADKYDIEYDKAKRKLKNFKLFIIMDTDDCLESEKKAFIEGTMFSGDILKEYIIPIYNISNLEDIMMKAKIIFKRLSKKEKGKEYLKIFPTNSNSDILDTTKDEIEKFQKKVIDVKMTNLEDLTKYCLEIA